MSVFFLSFSLFSLLPAAFNFESVEGNKEGDEGKRLDEECELWLPFGVQLSHAWWDMFDALLCEV